MNHIESQKLYYKTFEKVRYLSSLCYKDHTHEDILLALQNVTDAVQLLSRSNEFFLVASVNNYIAKLTHEDVSGHPRSCPILLTKNEQVNLFTTLSIFPSSIAGFISDDVAHNALLINSSLRTCAHHHGITPDSRAWLQISEKLAKHNDQENWLHLMENLEFVSHRGILKICLPSVRFLQNVGETNTCRLLELIVKATQGANSIDSECFIKTVDGIGKAISDKIASKLIEATPFKFTKTPLGIAYKLAFKRNITIDKSTLLSSLSSFVSPDGTSGASSFFGLCAHKYPSETIHILSKMEKEGLYSLNEWKEIAAYLIKSNGSIEYENTLTIDKDVIDSVVNIFISKHKFNEHVSLKSALVKKLGLSERDYFHLPAYAQFKRSDFESDMGI